MKLICSSCGSYVEMDSSNSLKEINCKECGKCLIKSGDNQQSHKVHGISFKRG
ncbi:MAG: hypothetical protein KKA64_02685 [Nanoarchaeota archaeon]|nr:hypothetical protein [Nanoarchaeota archaeon]